MLKTQNIVKTYKKNKVLDDVSFNIKKGNCLGIAGHNGSGKSTLLSIIAQVTEKDSGTIEYNGQNIIGNKAFMREKVGYVSQQDALLEGLTAGASIKFWQETYGIKGNEIFLQNGIANVMGINSFMKKKVESLSGGMKKRLCITIALMHKPEIIILDESFSPLDREYKKQLEAFLINYKNNGGIILYCSHETEDMLRLADDVLVLKKGRQVFYGGAETFPKDEATVDNLMKAI